MKTADIRTIVEAIVLEKYAEVKHKKYTEKLTPETRLYEDIGFDSLDIVEIGLEVEKEFDINLPGYDNGTIMFNINSMVEYIAKMIGPKTPDTTKTTPVQPAKKLQTTQSYVYYYDGVSQILEKTFNIKLGLDKARPAPVHDFINYMAEHHEEFNLAKTIAEFKKANQK